ncbi:hemolysin family protein [Myceligenerans xiligouense]|uniref:CBS domain containing-hemolysin-like protein n=1 Tax=Myceligenerans xiligouense TaxID=253184 RepID=A0A3N4Z918_9MICO|nr:hemolysin family protein [Myceligenerans xiligouense]RPF21872.1 CBS domain containing-hemolysin-like protein [Myceligenerans xiligouense]
MSDWAGIVTGIALLIGNAFFVGAEFALISARRSQIEPRAAAGGRAARLTLRALERVSLMMAGAQLGITMCSLGLGAVAEPAIAHAIEPGLDALGVPHGLLHPIALVIALTIVVAFHMTVGEMVPKNIAIAAPERAALVLGPPLYVVVAVFKPLLVVVNWIANHVLRLLKVEPKEEVASAFTAEEVAGFIAESTREGLLDAEAHALLSGALAIGDASVETIMVPRDSLVTAETETAVGEFQRLCVETGHSRFPVTDDGEIAGYVHIKDLLDHDPGRALPSHEIRPLVRLARTTPLDRALTEMQAATTHVALVTDDAGQVLGAAMLGDVINRVTGERVAL